MRDSTALLAMTPGPKDKDRESASCRLARRGHELGLFLQLPASERAFELIPCIAELGPGESVVIPRGMPHQATAIGDMPMTCVIAYNSPEREFVLVG